MKTFTPIGACIIFFPLLNANSEPIYSASIDSNERQEFNIHIHHSLAQSMLLENNNKNNAAGAGCKCSELYGDALHECMNSLSREDLKKNFLALNPRSARNYLRSLKCGESTELLSYFSEEEWQAWYSKLPPEIQEQLGKTKEDAERIFFEEKIISPLKLYVEKQKQKRYK